MTQTAYAITVAEGDAEEVGRILALFVTRAGAEAEIERRARDDFEWACHPERGEEGRYMERLSREHPAFAAELAERAERTIAAGFAAYRELYTYLAVREVELRD